MGVDAWPKAPRSWVRALEFGMASRQHHPVRPQLSAVFVLADVTGIMHEPLEPVSTHASMRGQKP